MPSVRVCAGTDKSPPSSHQRGREKTGRVRAFGKNPPSPAARPASPSQRGATSSSPTARTRKREKRRLLRKEGKGAAENVRCHEIVIGGKGRGSRFPSRSPWKKGRERWGLASQGSGENLRKIEIPCGCGPERKGDKKEETLRPRRHLLRRHEEGEGRRSGIYIYYSTP